MKIKNDIGFTLVELMVGCMIMGIVAAVAAPGFSGLIRNYKLSNAARMVWLDLNKAKMMAIKQGLTMRVDFDSSGTFYDIYRVNQDNTTTKVFTRNLTADYAGITLSSRTTTPISFGNTGTANAGTVILQRDSSHSKVFTIATTGRIGQIS